MIDYYVSHEIHSTSMEGARECLEIVGSAEIRVERINILLPITMVGFAIDRIFRQIESNRGDPNRRKAHALDIVEVADDTLPRASTVYPVSSIACERCGSVSAGKSISQNLVNRLSSPLCRSGGDDDRGQQQR